MKKGFIGIVILLAGLLPPPAAAGEVVAVLSSSARLYQQTAMEIGERLAGRPEAGPGPQTIAPPGFEALLLPDFLEPAALVATLRRKKPGLILALGGPALAAIREIGDIPILYLFALNGPRLAARQANITGINLTPAAADQLAAVQRLLPGRRRIGLLVPAGGGPAFAAEAHAAARTAGVSLVVRHYDDHRLIPVALAELAGRIDLFWLPPDPDLLRRQYLQAIMLFSLKEKVPVFTFSEPLLKEGATLAITPDFSRLAGQAARLSRAILAGLPAPPQPPEQLSSRLNRAVAEKLGLAVADPVPSGVVP